ncbi:MAG: phage tail sheath family protein [Chitinophagaceae bacterium]|nr:phage tail sheath family protein [Chitinophagaceae bacterium]
MATSYKTPGVYVEEIALFPPSVAQVETAIPAFIGYTEKDETSQTPTRVNTLLEYETLFGKSTPQTVALSITDAAVDPIAYSFTTAPVLKSYLYASIQLFFRNGGGSCYIVSAGADTATPAKADLEPALDKLEAFDEPTIIVIPDAVQLSDDDCYGLMNRALIQCKNLQDRFTIIDVKKQTNLTTAISTFRDKASNNLEETKYGAAYFPYLKTSLSFNFSSEAQVTLTGLPTDPTTLDAIKATDTAIYNKIKTALNAVAIELPPSGAIAGVYAAVDKSRGVWKAPANVSLTSVIGPLISITNVEQDGMNVDPGSGKSVNAIRFFTGKGTLVWGSRTLAGNDNEWKYVPVRRLFVTVEESVKKATARFVFEPNDANTWTKVRAMIENYLTVLWRDGALAGAKPEHAFYVKVGLGQTMSAQDILEGKMIVEIGMAAVRPAEFIILRFSHKMQES